MIVNQNRADVRREIRRILAARYACDEDALLCDSVTVVEARETPGQMRFPVPMKPLSLVTMGAGVVVSAHPERVPGLRAMIGPMQRDDIFSARGTRRLAAEIEPDGQDLMGPILKYTCSRDDLHSAVVPSGVGIDLFAGARVAECYEYLRLHSALYYPRGGGRWLQGDVMATVATRGGEAVGIAGASADTDDLWQIAVEVLTEARGCGVGRAVVGQLTRGILEAGKIPYYSTAVAHIGSRALAIGLGYWPVWTELYARDRPR